MERDEPAFAAGCASAEKDIAERRLIYRWNGHSGHWGHWMVTQFAKRFGIGVSDGFGVCFTTTEEDSFNEGYNSILVGEIDRRYGPGAFQSIFAEARVQSEESLWDAKQGWLQQNGLS